MQIALSFLLVVAGLGAYRSVQEFYAIPFGFEADGVYVADVSLPTGGSDVLEARQFYWQALVDQLSALPGVSSAALATAVPFASDVLSLLPLRALPAETQDNDAAVVVSAISAGYFRAIRGRVIAGRLLESTEDRVCLLPHSIASKYFGSAREAIGREVELAHQRRQIVGVVSDVAMTREASLPTVYVPAGSRPPLSTTLVIRGDVNGISGAFDRWMQLVGGDMPRPLVEGLDDVVARSVAKERATSAVVAAMAVTGLVIVFLSTSAIGRQWVVARHRDIGIRTALGAGSARLTGWLWAVFTPPVLAGAGGGAVLSVMAQQLASHLVPGMMAVAAIDLAIALASVLGGVAVISAMVMLRALKPSPADLLRCE